MSLPCEGNTGPKYRAKYTICKIVEWVLDRSKVGAQCRSANIKIYEKVCMETQKKLAAAEDMAKTQKKLECYSFCKLK